MKREKSWRIFIGADEMKSNEMNKMSEDTWWNETGETGETREKPTQFPFRPARNPDRVIETRTRNPSGAMKASA